jgi:demethylmacrocin O-methyltransferase
MTLDEIAIEVGTDKASNLHNYTEKYDSHFSKIRNQELKILEIGIQNGFSLKMWKKYFENSEIFGIDTAECSRFKEDRITPLLGSQNDIEFLSKVNSEYGPFDIIIDDGSHFNDDMKKSFDFLFTLLKDGGIYVVEDLHCCYWPNFTSNTAFMDRLKELLDYTNSNGKCGLADIKNLESDGFYQNRTLGEMSYWDQVVESVHLYRSIVFIKKYKK